jgi:ribosomal 50S subunit-associated protein YjgA (DUF615 family)
MRDADAEDLNLLFDLIENQDEAEGQLEELIEQTFQDLVSGSNEALQEFLEDNPELNMQQTRQLIRNAKKALNTPKTAPKDKLIALIRETIFGETE